MENTPQPAPTDAQPAAEPAAHDGTPHYGDFGHPADPTAPRHYQAPTNDGSNDNPDEFSEFRGKNASATEQYCLPGAIADPNLQRGHVEQNQHPEAIAAAEGAATPKSAPPTPSTTRATLAATYSI
ncbi:hypothetical protein ACFQT0_28250 [Hymenobacter humi]|uniref:Uncharacterized protein n=1 Tax=Hymenobacter humi TaxID=1411620 RepID=A0ABW2UBN7_9BACT